MNPWLSIPLEDYEGHMKAVGQAAALRESFVSTYARVKPRRVAILGCTAGGDFAVIQPDVTELAVGVDLNPAYIEAARQRSTHIANAVHWVCGDVLTVELPGAPFELVHAALLLEYVDAEQVFVRVLAHSVFKLAGVVDGPGAR
ncbi:MAG: class I SAM-dependent methyltransferase [Deltaproteobacteria bacterium]|nr:class I SAM-dependent methyltransferase [Deltaproteobacteria bacterium]